MSTSHSPSTGPAAVATASDLKRPERKHRKLTPERIETLKSLPGIVQELISWQEADA